LERTLNICRILYNNALAERKRQAEMFMLPVERDWLRYEDQAAALPVMKESPAAGVLPGASGCPAQG